MSAMSPERFVCIHGHFYQPPRENPWLEAVEVQDTALPYHDWNARVTAECYAPNAAARLLDADGYITALRNNYQQTLAISLEQRRGLEDLGNQMRLMSELEERGLLDRVVDLVEEGVDVAVRIASLPDSSLIARRVGEVRRLLVASPRYIAKHGRPTQPAQLKRHELIGFTGLMPTREWRFGEGRSAIHVGVAPRLELNDAGAAIAAAEAGEGITVAYSYMVARAIRRSRLATLLDDFMPPPVPVQLVYTHARLVGSKLRSFLDFAAPRLGAALAEVAVP